jgi:sugar phosphate isomerase/epimerase
MDFIMKKNQIAVQLYSFRDFIKSPEDIVKTLSRLKKTGYEAVELNASLMQIPSPELNKILTDAGMVACGMGAPSVKIVTDPGDVIARLQSVACRRVLYGFPHQFPANEAEAIDFAILLNGIAKQFVAAGMKLAYHNHAVEFIRFGRRTLMDILYEEAPALDAEMDTFWVQAGGGNPVSWIRRLAGRMEAIHLKDFGVADDKDHLMMPVGSGNLEWNAIIPAAGEAGVKWFVVEHDANCPDPFESFRASLDYLCEKFVS